MKRLIRVCVVLAGAFSLHLAAQTPQAPAAQRPTLAVLYTIDGFSDKAPARASMPNFKALMAEGVYYRQNQTVQTADPSNRFPPTPWAEAGMTSSVPNPAASCSGIPTNASPVGVSTWTGTEVVRAWGRRSRRTMLAR